MKKQIFVTSSLISQMIYPLAAHAGAAGDNLKNRLNEFLLQDAQRADSGSPVYSYTVDGKLVGTVQIMKLRVPFRHLMASVSGCTTNCDAPIPAPPPSCTTLCDTNPPAPVPTPTPTPAPVVPKGPSENFIKTYGYQIILGSLSGVAQPQNTPPFYFARKIRETAVATIYEVFQFNEISDTAQPKGAAYLEENRTTGELRFSTWTHWN
jgi:hypothetical protein